MHSSVVNLEKTPFSPPVTFTSSHTVFGGNYPVEKRAGALYYTAASAWRLVSIPSIESLGIQNVRRFTVHFNTTANVTVFQGNSQANVRIPFYFALGTRNPNETNLRSLYVFLPMGELVYNRTTQTVTIENEVTAYELSQTIRARDFVEDAENFTQNQTRMTTEQLASVLAGEVNLYASVMLDITGLGAADRAYFGDLNNIQTVINTVFTYSLSGLASS